MLLLLLSGGVGWGAFQAGLFDGLLGKGASSDTQTARAGGAVAGGGVDASSVGDASTPKTPTSAAGAGSEPGIDADASGTNGDAEPAGGGSTGEPQTSMAGTSGDVGEGAETGGSTGDTEPQGEGTTGGDEPAEGSTTGAGDDGLVAVADSAGSVGDGSATEEPDPPPDDSATQLSAEEQRLGAAVDERRIYMLKSLFTTKRTGSATTFMGGWQRCAKLDVDGVQGWRLPHRREMKLVNAVLSLPAGDYWTRTVPDEDKESAYVLDSSTGALTLLAKQEPNGEVVCVRRRDFPER